MSRSIRQLQKKINGQWRALLLAEISQGAKELVLTLCALEQKKKYSI